MGIISGVNIMTEFCSADSGEFKEYINYIDRDEATRKEHLQEFNLFNNYMDYMDDTKKTSGLFTADKEALSMKEKQETKKIFKEAQKKDSLMWQTVISFDNRWLSENGLYDPNTKILDEKKVMLAARASMNSLLEKEDMKNAIYTGAIHYNTDNIHVHIATVEPTPRRKQKLFTKYEKEKVNGKWRYKKEFDETEKRWKKIPKLDIAGNEIKAMETIGKFKEENIRAAKSMVVKELSDYKDINSQISKLISEKILKREKEESFILDKDLQEGIKTIYNKLPKNNLSLWKYGINKIIPLKKEIDKISKTYIDKYHTEDFERLEELLDKQQAKYQEAYGGNKNNFKENKIEDLYKRLGNAILSDLKEYEKKKRYSKKQQEDTHGLQESTNIDYESIHNENDTRVEHLMDQELEDKEQTAIINVEASYNEWSDEYKEARKLIFEEKEYKKALNILKADATKGNTLAIYELGDMYRFGRGRDINIETANKYYKKALAFFIEAYHGAERKKQKDYLAYRIGKMYNYGLGERKDYKKAVEWLSKSNSKFAYYSLGNIYYSGSEGIKQDKKAAANYYLKAQNESSHPYAYYKLGLMYKEGIGVLANDPTSKSFYKKALNELLEMVENKKTDENILYRLGKMYMKGEGADADANKGLEFIKKASALGNPYAQYTLGQYYLKKEGFAGNNADKAIKLLKVSATKGNSSLAQYALGKIYLSEEYKGKNVKEGLKWLKKAANNKSDIAAYTLGKLYLKEENEFADTNKAIKYFKISADQGNCFVKYSLAKIYLTEEYYNEKKAVDLLKKVNKSKEKISNFPKYILGKIYIDVDSNYFDKGKGIELLVSAANQGNSSSQCLLGIIFLKGEIVERDINVAKEWLAKAASNNNEFATQLLERVENQLNINLNRGATNFLTRHGEEGDFLITMKYLRKSLKQGFEKWRNMQEYDLLQQEIKSGKDSGYEL